MPKLTKNFIIEANKFYNNFNLKATCEKEVNDNKEFDYTPMQFAAKGLGYLKPEEGHKALAYIIAALNNQKGELSDADELLYNTLISDISKDFKINEQQIKAAQQYLGKRDKAIDSLLHEINEDGSIVTAQEIRDKEAEEKEKANSPEAKQQQRKEKFQEFLKKQEEFDKEAEELERLDREAKEKEENALKAQAKEEADKPYKDYIESKHKELKGLSEKDIVNKIVIDKELLEQIYPTRIRRLYKDPAPNASDKRLVADRTKGWRDDANLSADRNRYVEGQRTAAVNRLENYLGLRDKLESKSFLDILRHPINTIKEAIQMAGAKNDLKNAYGLTNDALDKIYNMTMNEETNGTIPSDFGVMDKDGKVHKTKAPQSEVDAKFNELKTAKSKEKLVDKTKDLRNDLSEMGKDVKINNEKVQEKQQVINKDLNIE